MDVDRLSVDNGSTADGATDDRELLIMWKGSGKWAVPCGEAHAVAVDSQDDNVCSLAQVARVLGHRIEHWLKISR
jgi:hypothetical protein